MPRRLLLAALLAATAAPVAAAPEFVATLGFDGIVRLGRPVHVRIAIRNDGPDWSGDYLLEEFSGRRRSVRWQLPLEIPAGARTVRWLTIAPDLGPGRTSGGRWALVGRPAGEESDEPLRARLVRDSGDVFVALSITDAATGFSGVRQALDPKSSAEIQMPAVKPEEAPPDPAAWEVVDAILVDLAVADRLEAAAWEGIASRVAQGASLLLHGASRLPELLPPVLAPGRSEPGEGPRPWLEPGALVEHSALGFTPEPGAERLVLEGAPLPWAVSRRVGAGRVTIAGVELRNLRAPLDAQVPLWSALLGLGPTVGRDELTPPPRVVDGLMAQAAARRAFPAASFAGVLALAAALMAVALFGVRRLARSRRPLRSVGLLCALAALPLFVIGSVSRLAEDRRPFVIEEHWEALGRTRTTTVVDPPSTRDRIRRLELPGWPVRLSPHQGVPTGLVLSRADPPEARDLRPALSPGLALQAERWAEAPAPFRIEPSPSGPLLRNLSGRDLDDLHLLRGRVVSSHGRLPDGEAVALSLAGPADRSSPAHRVLIPAAGRLQGLGVAGVIRSGARGLLVRPADGVVSAWLEERP